LLPQSSRGVSTSYFTLAFSSSMVMRFRIEAPDAKPHCGLWH
jgi:hypothetical protein